MKSLKCLKPMAGNYTTHILPLRLDQVETISQPESAGPSCRGHQAARVMNIPSFCILLFLHHVCWMLYPVSWMQPSGWRSVVPKVPNLPQLGSLLESWLDWGAPRCHHMPSRCLLDACRCLLGAPRCLPDASQMSFRCLRDASQMPPDVPQMLP